MCPSCGSWKSKVLETRKDFRFNWLWRRRLCGCGHEWQTYELPVNNLNAPDPIPGGKLER